MHVVRQHLHVMLQKHLSHSKDRYRFDTEYFVAHIVILIDLLNAYDMGPMNL